MGTAVIAGIPFGTGTGASSLASAAFKPEADNEEENNNDEDASDHKKEDLAQIV